MAILSWVMMGLAIWHFMIWLPDRVVGGIVGAFLIAAGGAVLGGLALNGFEVPGRADLETIVALDGIPGAIIALGLGYALGSWRESKAA
ncbi:MAG: hypothetical protein J7513_07710 [Solirubrobacteraceae bacterium]|nr:hypothetical protein [Solirubrobacteraceae bacterium]